MKDIIRQKQDPSFVMNLLLENPRKQNNLLDVTVSVYNPASIKLDFVLNHWMGLSARE